MKHRQKRLSARRLALAALLCMAPIQGAWAAPAPTAPTLGTASDFAVLGGEAVTCTGGGVVTGGDVGSQAAVTGFVPDSCTIDGGTVYAIPDATTAAAFTDFLSAYAKLYAMGCPTDAPHLLSGDLGGLTLSPGVYCIGEAANLTSQLTLKGGKGAVWIFLGESITTSGGGSVAMAKGGQACNVYWQVDTAATFINTDFLGNILAGTKITFTDSSLVGRALAQTGVTMASGDEITGCAGKQHGNPH